MATKFSEKEMADIDFKLKETAKKHTSSTGMRRTTVDELYTQAGISKGSFYSFMIDFYESDMPILLRKMP